LRKFREINYIQAQHPAGFSKNMDKVQAEDTEIKREKLLFFVFLATHMVKVNRYI